jgi:hypothetical protein
MNILKFLNEKFNYNTPFKIKIEVRRQESRHVSIDLYMTLDQQDELINCIENSGEVSNELIEALSECIRNKQMQTQAEQPHYIDTEFFERWKNYFEEEKREASNRLSPL